MRMRATDVLRRRVAVNASACGIDAPLSCGSFGLLRGVRMRIAAIHFELSINMPTEPIMRNHPADGAFDQQLRMASAAPPDTFRFVSADVTRKTHISFLFFLLSGE